MAATCRSRAQKGHASNSLQSRDVHSELLAAYLHAATTYSWPTLLTTCLLRLPSQAAPLGRLGGESFAGLDRHATLQYEGRSRHLHHLLVRPRKRCRTQLLVPQASASRGHGSCMWTSSIKLRPSSDRSQLQKLLRTWFSSSHRAQILSDQKRTYPR